MENYIYKLAKRYKTLPVSNYSPGRVDLASFLNKKGFATAPVSDFLLLAVRSNGEKLLVLEKDMKEEVDVSDLSFLITKAREISALPVIAVNDGDARNTVFLEVDEFNISYNEFWIGPGTCFGADMLLYYGGTTRKHTHSKYVVYFRNSLTYSELILMERTTHTCKKKTVLDISGRKFLIDFYLRISKDTERELRRLGLYFRDRF